MADFFFTFIYYASTPLVGVAFVLIVFLLSPKLDMLPRALIAGLAGTALMVLPGMFHSGVGGAESEANPIIYFSLFLVPTLVVTILASWGLAKRLRPSIEKVFE